MSEKVINYDKNGTILNHQDKVKVDRVDCIIEIRDAFIGEVIHFSRHYVIIRNPKDKTEFGYTPQNIELLNN